MTVVTLSDIADRASAPSADLIERLAETEGDIVVLGAAGKMGVSLATMAARALAELGTHRSVCAVSRFSDSAARADLEAHGVHTLAVDVSDPVAALSLPDAANVIYLIGRKFGTAGDPGPTWASNVLMPDIVMRRYRTSRLVALSSGNIYPQVPLQSGGADEQTPPGPIGEYAQTCLGRERIFALRAAEFGTRTTLVRLNYAVDCRYGVLTDIARAVLAKEPIDLAATAVNVIWQGDANRYALSSLAIAESPAAVLNVTGPETISVEWLARRFGQIFGMEPVLEGEPQHSALLSNAGAAFALFGYPTVPLNTMIDWTARWLLEGGALLDSATHFTERAGRY